MATARRTTRAKINTRARTTKANTAAPEASRQMPRPNRKALITILSALAILVIVVVLAFVWYLNLYNDPERVFWKTVNNGLATKGVVKQVNQTSSSVNNVENVQISFNPTPLIRDIKTVKDSSTSPATNLKLEGIGTAGADYQHYLLIDRPAGSGKGKPNYGKVYGMWLKSGDSSSAQLINSNLFGPFLFGNLNADQRKGIVDQLKTAYGINFASVKSKTEHGRRTYTYNVNLSLKKYVLAAQQYAQIYNLPVASQINPGNYTDSDKVSVVVSIDALSAQIRSIVYKSNNTIENYSGYGILAAINLPKNTVSSDQFQKAINSVE
jgi:hypothetical protein